MKLETSNFEQLDTSSKAPRFTNEDSRAKFFDAWIKMSQNMCSKKSTKEVVELTSEAKH